MSEDAFQQQFILLNGRAHVLQVHHAQQALRQSQFKRTSGKRLWTWIGDFYNGGWIFPFLYHLFGQQLASGPQDNYSHQISLSLSLPHSLSLTLSLFPSFSLKHTHSNRRETCVCVWYKEREREREKERGKEKKHTHTRTHKHTHTLSQRMRDERNERMSERRNGERKKDDSEREKKREWKREVERESERVQDLERLGKRRNREILECCIKFNHLAINVVMSIKDFC